jgi:hypothetical protein
VGGATVSVRVVFSCSGCSAEVCGTGPLSREFVSFSGRGYGFGTIVQSATVESLAPEGWVAYDPYTYATYCPACWAEIETPTEKPHAD